MGDFKGFDPNGFMLLEMNKFNDSRDFYESVKEDKSEADKLFEELGYKKSIDNRYSICFEKESYLIQFGKRESTIDKAFYNAELNIYMAKAITMQELKAINQKCKELGWLD